ncbi:MAG: NAD-dependent epimerase/dehydratase family protein [Candidatus Cloacimonetes bacterium]|nr:NAD-dependent epimerase/dehydratase family protein [Candidatus Cloacimonadota bacterium]
MKILLTGASGFIGRHIFKKLISEDNSITCIVRPNTDKKRLKSIEEKATIVKLNLSDTTGLKHYLDDSSFDVILHIGALRGGRRFSKKIFYKANVLATELLAENALRNSSKFIFCSSVGVFGAIPLELPANNRTTRQNDTYYHQTKIEAERIIQNLVMKGLNSVIIRPSITYGAGDYGFPYSLVNLVDKRLMFLPKTRYQIHLTDVDLLTDAFFTAVNSKFATGSAFIVADHDPVYLDDLVNFISQKLTNSDYAPRHRLPDWLFRFCEKIAKFVKSDVWISRFQLLSYSWYYEVRESGSELKLPIVKTIPSFNKVIYWYQNK